MPNYIPARHFEGHRFIASRVWVSILNEASFCSVPGNRSGGTVLR